jgi:hypothetical protein
VRGCSGNKSTGTYVQQSPSRSVSRYDRPYDGRKQGRRALSQVRVLQTAPNMYLRK